VQTKSLSVLVYVLSLLPSYLIAQPSSPQVQNHLGEAIYARACAACHDNPEATRTPPRANIRAMRRSAIEYAITLGYMRIQAKELSETEKTQVMDWLVMGQADYSSWLAKAMCKGETAKIDPTATPISATWGTGYKNLRQLSADQSGLTTADFSNLELSWSFALPQTSSMRSQPVVVGNTIFIASADAGRVYALDTETACVKWQYEGTQPLRSSLTYGEVEPGKPVIVVGDPAGGVTSIDALTGQQLWRTDIRLHEAQRVTGAPAIYK